MSDLNFDLNPAPADSTCNADTDPGNPDPTPCGKPAVVILSFSNEIDDRLLLCADCQLQRNRNAHQNDQAEAFEEQYGYPPDCDLADLAWRLGNRTQRLEGLLDVNAPNVILQNSRRAIKRTEEHVWNWLASHDFETESYVAAVNRILEDVKENFEAKPGREWDKATMLTGLKATRRIACSLEIDRAIKRKPPE